MFDVHVHTAPDVVARRADDRQTVAWYRAAGFSGCVLKAHCEPTVGRAAAATAEGDLTVYGGVVLNSAAGGLNPAAVTASLAMGGRVVWLPTVDARAHRLGGLDHPPPCAPQVSAAYATPPADPSTAGVVRTILRLVADADAVLATGHVSTPEAGWVVDEARQAGVGRVMLTHPTFTVPDMRPAEVRELTERGATAEITAYQLLHQPDCDPARLAAVIREVGYGRCVLSSDAGQVTSPPAPEALARLVDELAAEGLDRGALTAMASEIPEALVAP